MGIKRFSRLRDGFGSIMLLSRGCRETNAVRSDISAWSSLNATKESRSTWPAIRQTRLKFEMNVVCKLSVPILTDCRMNKRLMEAPVNSGKQTAIWKREVQYAVPYHH